MSSVVLASCRLLERGANHTAHSADTWLTVFAEHGRALVAGHHRVRVHANDERGAVLPARLEELGMADVHEVSDGRRVAVGAWTKRTETEGGGVSCV